MVVESLEGESSGTVLEKVVLLMVKFRFVLGENVGWRCCMRRATDRMRNRECIWKVMVFIWELDVGVVEQIRGRNVLWLPGGGQTRDAKAHPLIYIWSFTEEYLSSTWFVMSLPVVMDRYIEQWYDLQSVPPNITSVLKSSQ